MQSQILASESKLDNCRIDQTKSQRSENCSFITIVHLFCVQYITLNVVHVVLQAEAARTAPASRPRRTRRPRTSSTRASRSAGRSHKWRALMCHQALAPSHPPPPLRVVVCCVFPRSAVSVCPRGSLALFPSLDWTHSMFLPLGRTADTSFSMCKTNTRRRQMCQSPATTRKRKIYEVVTVSRNSSPPRRVSSGAPLDAGRPSVAVRTPSTAFSFTP